MRVISRGKDVGVALLAEGVDRNCRVSMILYSQKVALLAEGVDRNVVEYIHATINCKSPSSRRAWIEIDMGKEAREAYEGRPPRGGRG